jgi:4-amino-4-deoxy-L-arabinose transferase-like glycosyltransferase
MTSVALLCALGRELYGDTVTGLSAALLLALSPYDILFASTAFTDPLMTAFVLAALLASARGSLGAAGALAALAAATKQQALFFLPLVVVIGLLSAATSPPGTGAGRASVWSAKADDSSRSGLLQMRCRLTRLWARPWLRFLLGFSIVAGGVIWWDLARAQRPGFFEQSLISYGGIEAVQPQAWGERAVEWLWLVGAFWVSPWFNVLLIALLATWFGGGALGWWARWTRVDLALVAFAGLFLVGHWLVGFQVWDRYLLGLVPVIALLAARALVTLGRAFSSPSRRWASAILVSLALGLLLAGPVSRATKGDLPLGGDHGAYDGIDDLAAFMRFQAPPESVLYHHWLGYHYRFYLYGAPLRQHWYPDLADLVRDATVYRREPRYIAFPSWRPSAPAESALAEAGIRLLPVLETTRRDGSVSFRLYRMEGP